jgi:hypothetical protein
MKPYMDSFEREFSQELKESADKIVPPDKNEVWAEIEREIQRNHKKPVIPAFKKLLAVASLFIFFLTGVLVVTGDYVLADLRIFQTIKSVFGNVVSISGVSHSGNEVPVNKYHGIDEKSAEKKMYSIKEARQLLAYEIVIPGYVPEAYELAGVFVREETDRLSPVELHYIDPAEKAIVINENPIDANTAFSYNFRSNNAQVSTVQLNESEATLVYSEKTGLRKLFWQTSQMYYIVSGAISEEEIIKVGESLDK